MIDAQNGGLEVTDILTAGGNVTATGAVALDSTAGLAGNVSGVGITFGDAATFSGVGNQSADAGTGALAGTTFTKTTAGKLTLGGDTGVSATGAIAAQNGNLEVTDALTAGGNVTATGAVALDSTAGLAGNVSGVGITFGDAATFNGVGTSRPTRARAP